MTMPGRSSIANNSSYKYGFNGKEKDNEVKGEGNQYDYGMRIYDPRVGRFLSVDPLTNKYPELTPYQYASNRPIDGIDLDGLEYAPAGLFGPNGPRDNTAVQTMPLNAAAVQKVNIQSAARVNYLNQWIIAPDILGNGHIGPRYAVQANVAITDRNYYNTVGDNIAGGPGGATGYLIAGDKGSFVGAAGDQMMYSFGGLDQYGYLAKPKVIITSEDPIVNNIPANSPKFNPDKPALLNKNISIPASKNGYAPDFAGNPNLYPANANQKNIVQIKLTGSYTSDFDQANKEAGLANTPDGYIWHHVDNFNSSTGTATLQLIKRSTHQATIPHTGSVKQYEVFNKTTYKP